MDTTFQPIKKSNIYEVVIENLKHHIVSNNLSPGDRLPTEAELAQSFNVSRLSVREALKVLESLGVVQSKTRDGTRLRTLTLKPATDHLRFLLDVAQVPMQEIAVARQVMECAMMPVIVANAREEDYERIDAAIVAMENAVESIQLDRIALADGEFHCALLAATRNRAIEGFGLMLQEFFEHLSRNITLLTRTDYENSVVEHRAIGNALRDGNADEASRLMRLHLGVYDRFPFVPETLVPTQQGEEYA